MTVATTEQAQVTPTAQPVKQTWKQPSHPDAITVRSSPALASGSEAAVEGPSFNLTAVASKNIPANTLIAKNTSTTLASEKDYSTVQISATHHIRLNSDLLYCNHSCDPNVRFVTSTLASPNVGLEEQVSGAIEVWSTRDIPAGEELRFFYPSTEWEMAQPFRCSCGAEKCLGLVDGAKKVSTEVLRRYWLSGHIESLLNERDGLN
ncbi:hypothetical protein RJZ56_003349 [Blastomyces dermatitidis]|uniref:Post-SET domain-containing protein n=3 Tax=Blastomyces TaxID=229219 RepID=A0A179UDM3_BLAGS|nr:uncharacterized protein BDBG_02388 [Blastomyces gilchristii SLH14081]XP_045275267.1 uncharacterized protein BDCG_03172 [Blastomyces dermatitidis ER-3]EGE79548.1 hypothetical protein BDDG_02489 [Blastomyces dermatitidis ATCC 18188]EQL32908.1 hypothetical protein BDFG_05008 [Blastomyces dermatitidis ATCC 26199]EEQ88052.1 hypothetical protein BDCG_03172 [Blastomyces dermatitidis ER-3]OAT06106.1 hypothetical protein BDBG_02388 [Blastomyces gilchristii SLH14081]